MAYKFLSENEQKWRMDHVFPSYKHIPQHIVNWGNRYIFDRIEGPYITNFRMARVWKSSDCRRYQREKKEGCCGFFDELVVGPDGNKYLLGCNYGH